MRAGRVWQWSLTLAAVAWSAALFLAPGLLFPAGTFICHQRPDRSFFVHGHQVPVCARCTGLYVGASVAAPLALALAAAVPGARARWLIGFAAIPTIVTWSLEFIGTAHFSNISRFLAALPLGAMAAWLVLSTFVHRPSPIGHRTS